MYRIRYLLLLLVCVNAHATCPQAAVSWVVDTYHVKPDLVRFVCKQAVNAGIQPSLVLAVIAKESGFRPRVINRGSYGLMQVNYKAHRRLVHEVERASGGRLLNPKTNVIVGTRLLARFLHTNTTWRALQRYNGARTWKYPHAVLALRRQIETAASADNDPVYALLQLRNLLDDK